MFSKRLISFLISLTILVLLICFLLRIAEHPQGDKVRFGFQDKLRILFENFSETFAPQRRPPLTTLETEEVLKGNLPVPFGNFTRNDWEEFWNLFYGRFEEDSDRWPRRIRQLTKEEVEDALAIDYPQPFAAFSPEHWEIFWKTILKGKVF